jgi:hypothetical protein
MKKQTTTGVLKSVFTSAALVSLLFMNPAKAEEKNTGRTNNYELKYVGKLHEKPVFQLSVENPGNEEVYLTLQDEVGNFLYSNKFNEKNFSKKFQFDMNDGASTKIKMTLISKNTRKSEIFEIGTVQKFVEEVVVTKL